MTMTTSPEVLADSCQDHGAFLPCPKCRADEEWNRKLREADRLERQARVTRQIVVSTSEDRQALQSWADHLERRASQIRGELQREADRSAREEERITNGC